VQAVYLVEGESFDQAVVEHGERAAPPFFRRLEDQPHDAVEVACADQHSRGAKQHGAMPVMAAGVHDALIARRIGATGALGDPQCVHIRAERDCAIATARPQSGYHAGATDIFHHLRDAEAAKGFRDERGGPPFLETHLRMCVQRMAPGDHVSGERLLYRVGHSACLVLATVRRVISSKSASDVLKLGPVFASFAHRAVPQTAIRKWS
jgi:hypothetical protein